MTEGPVDAPARSRTPEVDANAGRVAPAQPTPAAQVARQAVDSARALAEPALRAAVDTLPAVLRHASGYHFGWWDRHGIPAAHGPTGKALRPALVLLAAQAVGGAPAPALPAAVAVELVHNFSLVHDDVMDGDETRRHRPTVWKEFGVAQAILVGDALLTLAVETLGTLSGPSDSRVAGPTRARLAQKMLSGAVGDLLHGQGEDLAFESRDDVTTAECLAMARRKTGALIECATGLGALLGGGTAEQVARLRGFGADLGLAFQITDDLLGIWGDPAVTGKPVYSDLRSRKKSLPVVVALRSGVPAARPLLAAYASEEELKEADLAEVAAAVDAAGGRQWCVAQASELISRALDRLHDDPPLARTLELTALARLLTQRDR
ncbi:geranylgeranyl diphosphate synthase type I [Hamadaea flava]|uniref:Polyprenyl synthetase family protein n=1 Tax=Hamadaea flava TaxID=1742688 RepID=A0ABV8LKQ0_9ACTN|nr:polyprenyl synthetase family protein [Hamadaea flava]MCP2324783.1 geranylgeranyl diphosphate synthase type I [Hamadaea flava]